MSNWTPEQDDQEWSYGEQLEWTIKTYPKTHFDIIKKYEKLLQLCEVDAHSIKDPKLREKNAKFMIRVKRDLEKIKSQTPEILMITEMMKKKLHSLK